MVNSEALLAVAQFLREEVTAEKGNVFNMYIWNAPYWPCSGVKTGSADTPCGTACCIGGAAQVVFNLGEHSGVDDQIGRKLDLSKLAWKELFYPLDFLNKPMTAHSMETTKEQAIALLEAIASGATLTHDGGNSYWELP